MRLSPPGRGSALALALACALWLACGDDTAAPPEPAAPAVEPPAPTPAPTPEPAEDDGPVARGKQHYQLLCASCHGTTGNGDGPAAAGLDPKPAKHSDGNYMNKLSDEYLVKVIRDGGAAVGKSPLMAPWGGVLTDEEIRDVVAYMRTLASPPYQP